jgi:NAD(P)-dependent dehydrogenase (short-subunit alcohol dehydrogenase family)
MTGCTYQLPLLLLLLRLLLPLSLPLRPRLLLVTCTVLLCCANMVDGKHQLRLDLADHSSIREFAAEERRRLKRLGQPLHVLVNNAGECGDPQQCFPAIICFVWRWSSHPCFEAAQNTSCTPPSWPLLPFPHTLLSRPPHSPFHPKGVMGLPAAPDGTDQHMAINHLGPYLLTRLLLPAMAPGSRVVTVSSRAHAWGSLRLEEGRIVGTPGNW